MIRIIDAQVRRLPSAAIALGDQALISGANFLIVLAMAHCTDMADFGIFSLAYGVLVFASGVHQAFMLSPMAILMPERNSTDQASYLAALERCHQNGILVAIGVAPLLVLIPEFGPLIATTVVAGALRLAQEFERRVAYARMDSPMALHIGLVGGLPLLVGAAWCLEWAPRITPEIGMAILMTCALAGWLLGRRLHAPVRAVIHQPVAQVLAEHHRHGKWMVMSIAIQSGTDLLYPFLIGVIMGLEKTALLMAARSIMNAGNVALNGLEAYAAPRLRIVWLSGDREAFRRTSFRLALLLGGTIGIPCLVAMLFPSFLVRVLLPEGYEDGAWILVALSGIFLLRALSRQFALMLMAMKILYAGFIAVCISAVFTILLGPAIVTHFGLPGAVAALALSVVILILVQAWWLRRGLAQGGVQ